MSTKVSALIWQIPLPVADKLVLLRLADYADDDGGSIFPSVATVARFCGISERAVQYTLKKFVELGLLFIVGNETGGRGRTRHYAVDLDRAAELAGPGGAPKRAQRVKRVQDDCTLNGHDESPQTPQRVQNSAIKGANLLHPTHQESVSAEEEDAGARAIGDWIGDRAGIPPGARDYRVIAAWLEKGADPVRDVRPAVERALQRTRQQRIRGFAYFTDEVELHRRARTAPEGTNVKRLDFRGRGTRPDGGVTAVIKSDIRRSLENTYGRSDGRGWGGDGPAGGDVETAGGNYGSDGGRAAAVAYGFW